VLKSLNGVAWFPNGILFIFHLLVHYSPGWKTHATTFSIVLNAADLTPVKTTNTFSRQDQVNLFSTQVPQDAKGRIRFKMNNKIYYGYFNPSTSKFSTWEVL